MITTLYLSPLYRQLRAAGWHLVALTTWHPATLEQPAGRRLAYINGKCRPNGGKL